MLQVSTNKKKAKYWFSLYSYKTDLVFHFMESNEIKVPNQYLVHYEHKWTKCIFLKFTLGASGFSSSVQKGFRLLF